MESTRAAGVLCHVSSLPGEYGIGTFGKEARRFVRRLAESGVKYWQILPLVQTGFGDSPYSSVCCTSGNPYFIDLETLAGQGLLTKKQLRAARLGRGDVDYGALYRSRYDVLRKAYARFDRNDGTFRAFVESGAAEDYALFMTAKKVFGGACFSAWDRDVRFREKAAMERLRTEHRDEYEFWQFLQYEFSRQWFALKGYANSLGIKVIGDMPLYVAYDSADVWAHPELFKLDEDLNPIAVAGVPPDYFSATGQLWGNPVYDWEAQKKDGYFWWKRRISEALNIYDVLRIDHFRGFDRYYEIPAGAETAVTGEWRDGPKSELFQTLPAEFLERIV
ncbi:MAG: 4-alpha-glucanotransferase, partial [Candidatus Gallimonas sp.]